MNHSDPPPAKTRASDKTRAATRHADPRSSTPDPRTARVHPDSRPRGSEGQSGASGEVRAPASRGAPQPLIVRGEAPSEPVLVSIVTAQDALEYTHAFVDAYCKHRFRASIAEALTVAAQELLENAINYGSVSSQVLFEIVEKRGSAAVRVTNETILARQEMLRSHIEKLTVNPEAVMLEEMKRSMGSRIRPMLGLARVVQEAGLGLELYVVGSRVTVLARAGT